MLEIRQLWDAFVVILILLFSQWACNCFIGLRLKAFQRYNFNYCITLSKWNIQFSSGNVRIHHLHTFTHIRALVCSNTSNVNLCGIVAIECTHYVVVSLNYISLMMTLGHYMFSSEYREILKSVIQIVYAQNSLLAFCELSWETYSFHQI